MNEPIEWLKDTIRGVLGALDWKCLVDEDVGAREVVSIFGAGELGNWVLINRIIPSKKVLLIMATCQENVPDGFARTQAIEFISRANFGILNGFFDMDLSDGDLRFASRVEYGLMDKRQFQANFKRTFQIVHGTFSKYLPGIVGISHGTMAGRHAVELVEGGTNTVPDTSSSPLLACVAKHLKASSTNFVCHPPKSVIRMPCAVQGINFHLRIKAMEETKQLYVFCNYPYNKGKVPTDALTSLVEYICRANWALPFGYFDLDLGDGELRFVTWLPANGLSPQIVQAQYVRALIVSAITTFVKYIDGIDAVVSGKLSPIDAIIKAESAENTVASPIPEMSDMIGSTIASSDDDDDDDEAAEFATDGEDKKSHNQQQFEKKSFVELLYSPQESSPSVLDFIATRGDSVAWKNPVESGLVCMTSSGLMDDSEPLSSIVERVPARCVTRGSDNVWIAIDLMKCRLQLTAYSLQHYCSADVEALRWWILEGSINGSTWVTLMEHKAENVLIKKNSVHTWSLEKKSSDFFRHFRLRLTGPNSSHAFHMACGGLKLYGHLQVDFDVEPHLLSTSPEAYQSSTNTLLPSLSHSFWLDINDVKLNEAVPPILTDSYGCSFVGTYCGIDIIGRCIDVIDESSKKALRKHLNNIAGITHPRLTKLIGVVDDSARSRFILVRDRSTQGALRDTLFNMNVRSRLTFSQRVKMSLDVSLALAYLHENNVIHHALQPRVVLVDDQFGLKISETGLSRVLAHSAAASSSDGLALAYCAPEVLNGEKATISSDLYSLGMLIFEIMTLVRPFSNKRIPAAALCAQIVNKSLRPTIPTDTPTELNELLSKLWATSPPQRPAAQVVCDTLQSLST